MKLNRRAFRVKPGMSQGMHRKSATDTTRLQRRISAFAADACSA